MHKDKQWNKTHAARTIRMGFSLIKAYFFFFAFFLSRYYSCLNSEHILHIFRGYLKENRFKNQRKIFKMEVNKRLWFLWVELMFSINPKQKCIRKIDSRHNGTTGNSAPIDDFRLKKLLHGTQNSSIKSSVMCNRNDAAHRFSLNRMLISFGWICAVQIVLRFTV